MRRWIILGLMALASAGQAQTATLWKQGTEKRILTNGELALECGTPNDLSSLAFQLHASHGGEGRLEIVPPELPAIGDWARYRADAEGVLILRTPMIDHRVGARNEITFGIVSYSAGEVILRYGSQTTQFYEQHIQTIPLAGDGKEQNVTVALKDDLLRLHLVQIEFKTAPDAEVALTMPEFVRFQRVPDGPNTIYELPMAQWVAHNYDESKVDADGFQGKMRFKPATGEVSFLFSPRGNYAMRAYNEFQMNLSSTSGGYGRLFFRTADGAFNDEQRVQFTVTPGENRVVTVPLPSLEVIEQLRLEVIHQDGTPVKVSNARLLTAERSGESAPECAALTKWEKMICSNGSLIPTVFPFQFRAGVDNDVQFVVPKVCGAVRQMRLVLKSQPECVITFSAPQYNNFSSWRNRIGIVSADSKAMFSVPNVTTAGMVDAVEPIRLGEALPLLIDDQSAPIMTPMAALNYLPESGEYIVALEWIGDAPAAGECQLEYRVYDVSRQLLGVETGRLEAENSWSAAIKLPHESAAISMKLENWQGISSDPKRLRTVALRSASTPGECWSGEWIWHDQGAKMRQGYFRRTFELPESPQGAKLQVTADDIVEGVWVNGRKLADGINSRTVRKTDVYEVAPLLHTGSNTLAIAVQDNGGGYGLRCELSIQSENSFLILGGDRHFKASPQAASDWNTPEFDDSAWPMAQELPAYPIQNDLVHEYAGKRQKLETLRVTDSQLVGDELQLCVEWQGAPERLQVILQDVNGACRTPVAALNLRSGEAIAVTLPPVLLRSGANLELTSPEYIWSAVEAIVIPAQGGEPQLPQATIEWMPDGRTSFLRIGERLISLNHKFAFEAPAFPLIKNCRDNEIDLMFIFGDEMAIYQDDETYDFSGTDRAMNEYLKANPDGYAVLEIWMDSWIATSYEKWNQRHPEAMVRDFNGNSVIPIQHFRKEVASWASEAYRAEANRLLSDWIEHIKRQPYADRVVGFMPVGGLGAEWVYYGTHNKTYVDYSAPFADGFRRYVQGLYGTIEEVNRVYQSHYQDFSEIPLPSPEERNFEGDTFTLIDPQTRQRLIDFRTYFSVLTTDLLLEFGEIVKRLTDSRSLYGTYYGYITYSAVPEWNENGHFALQRMLESPLVDFLVSIARYDNRYPGMAGGFMQPMASFNRHRKLGIVQSDLRSHRSPERIYGASGNVLESAAVLKREMAMNLLHGGVFEFGYYSKGWTAADSRLTDLIGIFNREQRRLSQKAGLFGDSKERIALIVDEQSFNSSLQNSPFYKSGTSEQENALNHAALGYDCYMLDDLEKIAGDYKVFLFSSCYRLTTEQQKWIEKLKRNDNTLIFLHAPGIVSERAFDPARVAEITGIRLEVRSEKIDPELRSLSTGARSGSWQPARREPIGPVFVPREGEIKAVTVADQTPAMTLAKFDDYTSIYVFGTYLGPEFLQELAPQLRLTIANNQVSDSTRVAGHLIAVHCDQGGRRTLRFPADVTGAQAVEIFTQERYPVIDNAFEVTLPDRETMVFELQK